MWKSNNQGFKEEIFIQKVRRDRNGEPRQRGCSVVVAARQQQWWPVKWVVPYPHVADKNQEGHLETKAIPALGQTAQPWVPALRNQAS